jgi:predicted secreted protein
MRAAAVIAALALGACASPAPAPVAAPAKPSAFVELTNPANGTRIALLKGGELKLLLDADPVNATQWFNSAKGAPVLSPIGERIYVAKSANVANLADGAWNVFRFRADTPGKVDLVFETRRIDQAGPASRSVRYQVSVE